MKYKIDAIRIAAFFYLGVMLMIIPYFLTPDLERYYWVRVLMVNLGIAFTTSSLVYFILRRFNTGIEEKLDLAIKNAKLQSQGIEEVALFKNRDFLERIEKEISSTESIRMVLNPVLPKDQIFFLLRNLNYKRASKVKLIVPKPNINKNESSKYFRRFERSQLRNYSLILEETYHPEIEIREIPATTVNQTYVVTDNKVIVFAGNLYAKESNLFGFLISKNSEVGKDLSYDFDILWKEGQEFQPK